MLIVHMLRAALMVINGLLIIYSLYAVVMALLSFAKTRTFAACPPRHRFAVLIAARNEEGVIGHLVESLLQQNYPRALFDVIVIPNNCTDNTRKAALDAGALIMDCPVPVRSKGDVMNFAFAEICCMEQHYDAICVIDADNLAHPDFLREMNHALCGGARVAQGYRDSKNPHDTAISGSYAIYFWLLIRFFSRARHVAGLSMSISGSGFMIRTDLIREMGGVHTVTVTEDLELTLLCYLADTKVAWVPRAIIYDEQPLTFRQSWQQRKRWTSGMYQIIDLYYRRLVHKTVRERSLQGLDLIFLYLAAHMQIFSTVMMAISGLLNLFYVLDNRIRPETLLNGFVLSTLVTWLVVTSVGLLTVILEKKLHRGIWKGVLYYWVFLMSWLPINIVCLFRKSTRWEQIKHSRSISYQDLRLRNR